VSLTFGYHLVFIVDNCVYSFLSYRALRPEPRPTFVFQQQKWATLLKPDDFQSKCLSAHTRSRSTPGRSWAESLRSFQCNLTNEKFLADAFFCPPSLEGGGPLAVEDLITAVWQMKNFWLFRAVFFWCTNLPLPPLYQEGKEWLEIPPW
jgi:hypothetical protein